MRTDSVSSRLSPAAVAVAIAAVSLIGLIASYGAFGGSGLIGGAEQMCTRDQQAAVCRAGWAWVPVPVAICENYADSDVVVGSIAVNWTNTGAGGLCALILIASLTSSIRRR